MTMVFLDTIDKKVKEQLNNRSITVDPVLAAVLQGTRVMPHEPDVT